MPRNVAADHFSTGVWRASGRIGLRHCTCLGCGQRLSDWWNFRIHRVTCSNALDGRRVLEILEQLDVGDAEDPVPSDRRGDLRGGRPLVAAQSP